MVEERRRKVAPRFVNLSANMDPRYLSRSAVDLNLKLMRWHILPSLDLENAINKHDVYCWVPVPLVVMWLVVC